MTARFHITFQNGFWQATRPGYRLIGTGATPTAAMNAFKAACVGLYSQLP